jgi:hypothetical protein
LRATGGEVVRDQQEAVTAARPTRGFDNPRKKLSIPLGHQIPPEIPRSGLMAGR